MYDYNTLLNQVFKSYRQMLQHNIYSDFLCEYYGLSTLLIESNKVTSILLMFWSFIFFIDLKMQLKKTKINLKKN